MFSSRNTIRHFVPSPAISVCVRRSSLPNGNCSISSRARGVRTSTRQFSARTPHYDRANVMENNPVEGSQGDPVQNFGRSDVTQLVRFEIGGQCRKLYLEEKLGFTARVPKRDRLSDRAKFRRRSPRNERQPPWFSRRNCVDTRDARHDDAIHLKHPSQLGKLQSNRANHHV